MRIAGTPALSPVARRLLFADAAFEGFVALALSVAARGMRPRIKAPDPTPRSTRDAWRA